MPILWNRHGFVVVEVWRGKSVELDGRRLSGNGRPSSTTVLGRNPQALDLISPKKNFSAPSRETRNRWTDSTLNLLHPFEDHTVKPVGRRNGEALFFRNMTSS